MWRCHCYQIIADGITAVGVAAYVAVVVLVEAVERNKARLRSDDSVVLAWTWMRIWARRKARSYLGAARERGKVINYRKAPRP